ncbi:MAG: ribonuclease HII [Oscillatoriales cyanobacterium]|uniref:ribonuclease HII n=1 Tax=unclassified Microcoleus TaxID=2642155 RepID=UPI001D42769B|nr:MULTISPECIES: ribonuclease HII [unclassified Microcoleus]TAE80307.1 MAG: ribonuclease HII [Oscillatoriales cyanobacterium]TAE96329.1 MAG: ribonuclease HII [Oscillatoriales cyanobacterium]TAF17783.1 MAG: ribonuclease HII [Oscillatoriales cyanobacterium]TAF34541.1 MAG: ribonuclease HII [Oscillatoriales cyanobacterium]TAF53641.1 MAG: ribonuclease HII [Oscillatoriales cyanobacterium]
MKEEGRGKKEEERRKKEEGRRKKEEGSRKKEEVEIFTLFPSFHLPLSPSPSPPISPSPNLPLSPSPNLPRIIAGVDEVGRGALFGPVVAAACILPDEVLEELVSCGVRDSKQLSAAARSRLAAKIRAVAVDCQIGAASVKEIDRLNILQASLLAMKRAILKLNVTPDLCLVDGNQRIPNLAIDQETMVKGDARSIQIAAASIVAKVWRDELILRMAVKYPEYDLTNNKGYGTAKHKLALELYGASVFHRTSFSPCR